MTKDMRRIVAFPRLHPAQVEHTREVAGFLERLAGKLDLQEHPEADRHPNCAAVPGSLECDNALTPMCEACPWWTRMTGGDG
jgi:hypothetical protein